MNIILGKALVILTDYFDFEILKIEEERQSVQYLACNFEINGLKIIFRQAKITPTKIGQFVTLWKRNNIKNLIEPFDFSDKIDFIIINCKKDNNFGYFVFTKEILLKQGVFSTEKKEGKRAIRVYPSWDFPTNKQALKTKEWQEKCFVNFTNFDNDSIEKLKNTFFKPLLHK